MENPVVFFFGAGAESKSFGLPNGAKYTRCTMCRKRTKLYEELRRFYKGRCSETYSGDYSGCFLFNKDSHTFREIIINAAEKCYNKGDANEEIKKFLIDKEEYDAAKRKKDKTAEIAARAKVDGFIGKMYDMIILDSDELEEDKKNYGKKPTYSLIEDNLSYYGAVEKDFSTIIYPKGAGKRRFWRLLNYFWSAYFTILEPLCRDFGWYQKDKKSEFYRYVLNNLESVTRQIYDGYNYGQADSDQGNYYRKISEAYSDCHAITTNYTPFVEHYFAGRNTYLAGRLSEFEFPCELSVKDIREYTIDDNAFVFPFLMTQAPVKPIITPSQILEYGEFLQKLNMADTLVIIGYSLCQEDNHINAMLHQFAVDKGKRIIYCYYREDNEVQEQSKIRETVCERLRLEEDCNNLEIVQNTGDADELLKKISHLLKEESAHV